MSASGKAIRAGSDATPSVETAEDAVVVTTTSSADSQGAKAPITEPKSSEPGSSASGSTSDTVKAAAGDAIDRALVSRLTKPSTGAATSNGAVANGAVANAGSNGAKDAAETVVSASPAKTSAAGAPEAPTDAPGRPANTMLDHIRAKAAEKAAADRAARDAARQEGLLADSGESRKNPAVTGRDDPVDTTISGAPLAANTSSATGLRPESTVRTPPRTTVGDPAPAEASYPPGYSASGYSASPAAAPATASRTVRLTLARVDPISTAKLAFLLSVALGVALVAASVILWEMLNGLGVFDSLNSTFRSMGGMQTTFDLYDYIGLGRVVSVATLVAACNVLIISALSIVGAILYNIAGSLVGGLHVTLSDD